MHGARGNTIFVANKVIKCGPAVGQSFHVCSLGYEHSGAILKPGVEVPAGFVESHSVTDNLWNPVHKMNPGGTEGYISMVFTPLAVR
jgi:hypothetical protein